MHRRWGMYRLSIREVMRIIHSAFLGCPLTLATNSILRILRQKPFISICKNKFCLAHHHSTFPVFTYEFHADVKMLLNWNHKMPHLITDCGLNPKVERWES